MKESAHIALSVVKLLIDRGELSVEEDEIYNKYIYTFTFQRGQLQKMDLVQV